ncbi:MAG: hypothetical protein RIT81_28450 [Deltaproteobacteria bacterium]
MVSPKQTSWALLGCLLACSSGESLELEDTPPPPPAATCVTIDADVASIPVAASVPARGVLTPKGPEGTDLQGTALRLLPRDPSVMMPVGRITWSNGRGEWTAEVIRGVYDVTLSQSSRGGPVHQSPLTTLTIEGADVAPQDFPVARWTLAPKSPRDPNQYLFVVKDAETPELYSDTWYVAPGTYRAVHVSTAPFCQDRLGCGVGYVSDATLVEGDVVTEVDLAPVTTTLQLTDGTNPVVADNPVVVLLTSKLLGKTVGFTIRTGMDHVEARVVPGDYDVAITVVGATHRVARDVHIVGGTVEVIAPPGPRGGRSLSGVALYDGGDLPGELEGASIELVDPTGSVDPVSMTIRRFPQTGNAHFRRDDIAPGVYDVYFVPAECPDLDRPLPCAPSRVLEGVDLTLLDREVEIDLGPEVVTVDLRLDGEPLRFGATPIRLRMTSMDHEGFATTFEVGRATFDIGLRPGAYRVQLVGTGVDLFGVSETRVDIDAATSVLLDARSIRTTLHAELDGRPYAPVGDIDVALVPNASSTFLNPLELEWSAAEPITARLLVGDYTLTWDAERWCADDLPEDEPRACASHRIPVCVEATE